MRFPKRMLIGLLGMACIPAAVGCGYHVAIGDHLEVMHPSSLTVAVALRRAAEAGTLDWSELEAALHRPGKYPEVVSQLEAFGSALESVAAKSDGGLTFSLGFVESGLWTRYAVSDGKVTIDIHGKGPSQDEAVVLTGEPVLTEILNGTLPLEYALSNHLVVIEGKNDEQAAIHQALSGIARSTPGSGKLAAVASMKGH